MLSDERLVSVPPEKAQSFSRFLPITVLIHESALESLFNRSRSAWRAPPRGLREPTKNTELFSGPTEVLKRTK
jgi:hypothetical protein